VLETNTLVNNLDELNSLAKYVAGELLQLTNINIVVLFDAEMGAGKTTFTRLLGKELGVVEKITSPSFVGLNYYSTSSIDLYHYDLYQVQPSYWDIKEILEDPKKKLLIFEWSELLNEELRKDFEKKAMIYQIRIRVVYDNSREVSIKPL
jgi:tRNA threonylcarbamoyladenosine biosynthesis protein TsaE